MTDPGADRGLVRGLARLAVLAVLLAVVLHVGGGLPDVREPGLPGVDVPAPGVDGPAPDADRPDGATPAATTAEETVAGLNRTRVEGEVHRLVNERRREHGAGRLAFDADLRTVARYHGRDMARRGYFAHTDPDGETVLDRYRQFGYDCRAPTADGGYATGGENLFKMTFARGSFTETEIAERTVEGWLESPGHRENLLAPHWRREGVGVVVTADAGRVEVYVTQNFC